MKWILASERLPLHHKNVFCIDEKGRKEIAFYCKEEDKVVCEFEDYDDQEPDFLIVDKEKEVYYYKTGWYSIVENVGTYDSIIYERKIAEWYDESEPIKEVARKEDLIYSNGYKDGFEKGREFEKTHLKEVAEDKKITN